MSSGATQAISAVLVTRVVSPPLVAAFCLAVLPKYGLLCTSKLTCVLICSDGRTASFSGLVSP